MLEFSVKYLNLIFIFPSFKVHARGGNNIYIQYMQLC